MDSTPSPASTSAGSEDDAARSGTASPTPVTALAGTPQPAMTSTEDDGDDDATPNGTPPPTPDIVVTSTPSPVTTRTSTDDDATSTGTISPTSVTSPKDYDDDDDSDFDCSPCEDLTDAQIEALARYGDDGGKTIVCDPTCLDGVSDPLHCNCEL